MEKSAGPHIESNLTLNLWSHEVTLDLSTNVVHCGDPAFNLCKCGCARTRVTIQRKTSAIRHEHWKFYSSSVHKTNDDLVSKLSRTAACCDVVQAVRARSRRERVQRQNKEEKQDEGWERVEKCLVLKYMWQGERGEGLGPNWSYAVLCDKVAQVFLSMNFNRRKRRSSLMTPVLSSAVVSFLFLCSLIPTIV